MARIVLNTFGSFGDLHPYLAVAIGLKQRGHRPVLATAEVYRAKIEAEGIEFAPVRPDIGEMAGNSSFLQKIWHPKHGTKFLVRDYIMPAVEASFEDLLPVCKNADLLLTHAAAYAGPVVAEHLKMPWLSVVLQPMAFLSRYDPPVLPPARWLQKLEPLGSGVIGAVLKLGKASTAYWARPVAVLRRRIGLPKSAANPMFEGQFSPFGTLCWFSAHYAKPQPDWPARTRITGFPFYDQLGEGLGKWSPDPAVDASETARFLASGSPPLLFTLGSSAVMQPGSFYRESFEAAQHLGMRAILLAGAMPRESFPQPVPESIHIASYAPYSKVMPLCAAVIHQGGIGTTAQTLHAGKPMIIVPWAHDQPDNAARIEKLGCGLTIPRNRYTASSASAGLKKLLSDGKYAKVAHSLGQLVAAEDGIASACSAVQDLVDSRAL